MNLMRVALRQYPPCRPEKGVGWRFGTIRGLCCAVTRSVNLIVLSSL
ncbi:MAG: hypothetical protein BMS9Abin20_1458 [Acidimicrobiia bacterium]|nr:MAG: hypothetical protein BMS9Abin20_1458 [Acidimicrobiia bacterium]